MNSFKLIKSDSDRCAPLFGVSPYWSPIKNTANSDDYSAWFKSGYSVLNHAMWVDGYLWGGDNFHAWGGGVSELNTVIYFYESTEEPAWYLLGWRNRGTALDYRAVLDGVIKYNEGRNRYKFYALEAPQHVSQWREDVYGGEFGDRYRVIDEYVVPPKALCWWTNAWELLYKRMLIPELTQVSCYYLDGRLRKVGDVIGGNL